MKDFFSGYARHLFRGLLIILGGLFVYLLAALALGYQPYSNRPGSAWNWNWALADGATYLFLLRFLLLLGAYLLAMLTATFIFFKLLGLVGYNRIVFTLLGGLVTGWLTFYLTQAIGWHIAIAETTVIVAGGLGLVYGFIFFPAIIHPRKPPDTSRPG